MADAGLFLHSSIRFIMFLSVSLVLFFVSLKTSYRTIKTGGRAGFVLHG